MLLLWLFACIRRVTWLNIGMATSFFLLDDVLNCNINRKPQTDTDLQQKY